MLHVFLVAVSLVQTEYEERLRAANEAVAAERQRAATALESLKAWVWAREEYRKIARLSPDDETPRRKLVGSDALPTSNDKSVTAKQYHDAIATVSRVAVSRHTQLALWCSENNRPDEARWNWRQVLLHAPSDAPAIKALGFVGSGVSATDSVWRDASWKAMLEKADAGQAVSAQSEIEKKWGVKTVKRAARDTQWEALGLADAHLDKVVRQAGADAAFLQRALGVNGRADWATDGRVMLGHPSA